jgi:hypothetical protein
MCVQQVCAPGDSRTCVVVSMVGCWLWGRDVKGGYIYMNISLGDVAAACSRGMCPGCHG